MEPSDKFVPGLKAASYYVREQQMSGSGYPLKIEKNNLPGPGPLHKLLVFSKKIYSGFILNSDVVLMLLFFQILNFVFHDFQYSVAAFFCDNMSLVHNFFCMSQ